MTRDAGSRRLGPYWLEGELARGPESVVHRARDGHGRAVALKVHTDTRQLPGDVLLLCQHHPGLVRCLDAGCVPGTRQIFTVTELVDGTPLGPEAPIRGVAELRAVTGRLLSALSFLHRRLGLLHRDLKADNVLIETTGGRPVILDPGLCCPLSGSDDLSGTPHTMAPELFRGARASVASDLWAAGLVLAEAALGRPLFQAIAADDRLAERLSFDGFSPGEIDTIGDGALAALLERLLDPDPARRPEDVDAAVAGLPGRDAAAFTERARDELAAGAAAALAEADPSLAARRAALESRRVWIPLHPGDAHPAAVRAQVAGFAAAVEEPGPTLSARLSAHAQSAGRAASWADVRALTAALSEQGPIVVALTEPLSDSSPLSDLLTQLDALADVDVFIPPAPTAEDATKVLTAWIGERPTLASRLASTPMPSWLALGSALSELTRTGAVSAAASGLALDEARLPAAWPVGEGASALLPEEEDARALLAILGCCPQPLSPAVLREISGCAVTGTLERLAEQGWIERWRSLPEDLFAIADPLLARQLADGRDVGASQRTALVEALLAAGDTGADDEELPADLAAAVARTLGDVLPSADGEGADSSSLTVAFGRVAETLRRQGRLELACGVLRRALAGAAAQASQRPDLHKALVEILTRAHRFDEARQAVAQGARDVPAAGDALAVRDARVLLLQGERAAALERIDAVDLAALPREDAVRGHHVRAQIHAASGRLEEALGHVREAFRRQGDASGSSRLMLLEYAGVLERSLGRPREALRRFEACVELARELGKEMLVGTFQHNIALALRDMGERRRAVDIQVQAVETLERLGDVTNLARTLNSLGAITLTLGNVDTARHHLARALTLYRQLGDRVREGMVLNNTARALAAQGQHDEAADAFARALELREQGKDVVGQAAVLLTRGPLRLGRGRLDEAAADLRAAQELLADVRAPGWQLEVEQLAARLALARGDMSEARAAAERARVGAESAGAGRELLVARDLLARAGGPDLEDVGSDEEQGPWLADLLVTRALSRESTGNRDGADADFGLALSLLGSAPNGPVEARTLVARVETDLSRLEGELEQETPDMVRVGALVSRATRDRDRVAVLVQLHDLQPFVARLDALATRFGALRPGGDMSALAALAERVRDLERLADIGKALNTERDTQELLELILDSAIELTGAARGFLILFEGRGTDIRVARNISESSIHDPEFEISHSVARQVVETGEALRTANAIDDPRLASAASIAKLNLLSILCVPLTFRGRTLGAVYLDHPQVVGRFEERHLDTVSALSEQAAIALENTRLSDGLARRNAELGESRAEIERLNEALRAQLERREAELEEVKESLDASRKTLGLRYDYGNIVTASPRMFEVLDLLDHITDTDYPVIISGESGTGKELIARAVHFNGPRKDKNFLSLNCAAIAEPLVESELFGYVRGAFTGADRDRKGLLDQAHEGTLFLDEIGDMSHALQTRLLRVLQEGDFIPVGGREVRHVDVRVLCATHRDLESMVAQSRFREDLYYRLAVARVQLPPLRERPDDIGLLLNHLLERHGGQPRILDPEALAALRRYPWPGNVRQLENWAMNLMMFDAEGERVTGTHVKRLLETVADPGRASTGPDVDASLPLKARVDAFERRQLQDALSAAGGNKAQAARTLGVTVRTLYKMLERLGVTT